MAIPNGDGTVGVGSTLVAAEKGLDATAESKTAVKAVQSALREEGHRVSQGAIRSGAKFGARLTIYAHVGFAVNDGRKDYNACRE